jgi:hypothetical protein
MIQHSRRFARFRAWRPQFTASKSVSLCRARALPATHATPKMGNTHNNLSQPTDNHRFYCSTNKVAQRQNPTTPGEAAKGVPPATCANTRPIIHGEQVNKITFVPGAQPKRQCAEFTY